MKLLNQTGIETQYGYRTITLYQADITRLNSHVDALVISAAAGNYDPIEGTVIEALRQNHGLVVGDLARRPDLDLRHAFNCWISTPLEGVPFARIICAEVDLQRWETEESAVEHMVEGVFMALTILEARDVEIRTVAMPLLGTGNQEIAAEQVLGPIMDRALRLLRYSRRLNHIRFIEINERRAGLLSDAMSKLLGTVRIEPQSKQAKVVRGAILAHIEALLPRIDASDQALFHDIQAMVSQEGLRSQDLGMGSRRLVEYIVHQIVGPSDDLVRAIQHTGKKGAAPWVRSYLQLLRVFGNEAAHQQETDSRIPSCLTEPDLLLTLSAMERVLAFWQDYLRSVEND